MDKRICKEVCEPSKLLRVQMAFGDYRFRQAGNPSRPASAEARPLRVSTLAVGRDVAQSLTALRSEIELSDGEMMRAAGLPWAEAQLRVGWARMAQFWQPGSKLRALLPVSGQFSRDRCGCELCAERDSLKLGIPKATEH
jgi:hypothetical protein